MFENDLDKMPDFGGFFFVKFEFKRDDIAVVVWRNIIYASGCNFVIAKVFRIFDKEFVKIEAIICSMTKKEKRNTKLLNASRRQRIAKGSGTTVQDINKFIQSFEMTQKMMKKMKNNKGGMKNLMKGIDEKSLRNFKF